MRPWHILSRNPRQTVPRQIVFFDCETQPEPSTENLTLHKLKLGVACSITRPRKKWSNEQWLTFRGVDEFWNWLEKQVRSKTKCYVFAHNIDFDFWVVAGFRELKRRGWTVQKWVVDSNRFIVQTRKDTKTLVFLDSMNFFRGSLASIGEFVGILKTKVNFNTCTEEELETYCRNDVAILKEFILRWVSFIEENDLGHFQLTLPSQAFAAFRHKFYKTPIYIHGHEDAVKLERAAYKGGRAECFFIGKIEGKKLYKLDVNSMYPYVMSIHEYPTKFVFYEYYPSMNGLKNALQNYAVIADVTIRIEEPAIALKDEKLLFPIGTFRTVLTSPELEWVLQHGEILTVHAYAIYEKAPIFKEYITFFHELKSKASKEGNRVAYTMSKMMLNSLYGKWGQKNEVIRKIEENSGIPDGFYRIYDMKNKTESRMWVIEGTVFQKVGEEESYNSFPAISAFITAHARMHLWTLIKTAGQGHIYYCDTDSLFVDEEGLRNLKDWINPEKLGHLKIEGSADEAEFRNVKDYTFGAETKRKGIRPDAVQTGENTFKQPHFMHTRTLLRLNHHEGAIEKETTKNYDPEYKKGNVTSTGWVAPFRWEEIEEKRMLEQQSKMLRIHEKTLQQEYLEWKQSDYYDPQLEDETLTQHEKFVEWQKNKWRNLS